MKASDFLFKMIERSSGLSASKARIAAYEIVRNQEQKAICENISETVLWESKR